MIIVMTRPRSPRAVKTVQFTELKMVMMVMAIVLMMMVMMMILHLLPFQLKLIVLFVRDLNPKNVLLSESGHVLLSHFSTWIDVNDEYDLFSLELNYCAPGTRKKTVF